MVELSRDCWKNRCLQPLHSYCVIFCILASTSNELLPCMHDMSIPVLWGATLGHFQLSFLHACWWSQSALFFVGDCQLGFLWVNNASFLQHTYLHISWSAEYIHGIDVLSAFWWSVVHYCMMALLIGYILHTATHWT